MLFTLSLLISCGPKVASGKDTPFKDCIRDNGVIECGPYAMLYNHSIVDPTGDVTAFYEELMQQNLHTMKMEQFLEAQDPRLPEKSLAYFGVKNEQRFFLGYIGPEASLENIGVNFLCIPKMEGGSMEGCMDYALMVSKGRLPQELRPNLPTTTSLQLGDYVFQLADDCEHMMQDFTQLERELIYLLTNLPLMRLEN